MSLDGPVMLEAGRARIATTRAGTTDRPALVLLPGWPHSRALYDGVVEELSDAFLVLAMDLPDIGDSRGAPPSAQKSALANLLLTAAENAGARDITIAGLDVGGMIAFAAARDHGERISRAIVINTVVPGLEPWEALLADPHVWHFAFHAIANLPEILVRGRKRVYFDFFHDVLAGDPAKIPDALRERFAQAYERPEALKAGFDWYRAMASDAKHNAKPKAISAPILYIRGDADGRSIEAYRNGLKTAGVANLDTRVVAGAGELLPIEAPAAFIEIIRDFAVGAHTANAHDVSEQNRRDACQMSANGPIPAGQVSPNEQEKAACTPVETPPTCTNPLERRAAGISMGIYQREIGSTRPSCLRGWRRNPSPSIMAQPKSCRHVP